MINNSSGASTSKDIGVGGGSTSFALPQGSYTVMVSGWLPSAAYPVGNTTDPVGCLKSTGRGFVDVPEDTRVNVLMEFSQQPVAVTFNHNYGSTPAVEYQYIPPAAPNNKAVSITPERSGYTLDGWYTDPATPVLTKWDFGLYTITGPRTLYAKWTVTPGSNPIIALDIDPATVAVAKGGTKQFSAITTYFDGTTSPATSGITWTVTGGGSGTTISASGLLTVAVGETAATLTVEAARNAGNGWVDLADATVTVTAAEPTEIGLYRRDTATDPWSPVTVTGSSFITEAVNVVNNDFTANGPGEFLMLVGAGETVGTRNLTGNGLKLTVRAAGIPDPIDGTLTTRVLRHSNDGTPSDNGGVFDVRDGAELTLDNGITLEGHSTNNGSLVYVEGASLIMKKGSAITGNTRNAIGVGGGGVYVQGGSFDMEGGTISDNTTANGSGGGVYIAGGTFSMSGDSSITGNTAPLSGGGVYVASGTFEMNGGTISDNTANTGNGGGVYFNSTGTFTMSGGTISDNIANGTGAQTGGGGVYMNAGRFEMSGSSTISGNRHTGEGSSGGGGVYFKGTIFTMSENSVISNNSVRVYGGGVFVTSGNFTMSGNSAINGGNSANWGGGVALGGTGTFTMSGGTIAGNSAIDGGGVYVNTGTFTMQDGIIEDNTVAEYGGSSPHGGGVCVRYSGTFIKTGPGEIKDNTAPDNSGIAVYVYDSPPARPEIRYRDSAVPDGGPINSGSGQGLPSND